MRRIVLFSNPTEKVIEKITPFVFPEEFSELNLAYMPSDGAYEENHKFLPGWQKFADNNNASLIEINNSLQGKEADFESKKLLDCNILLITGGNTFTLLRNLKRSNLDKSVLEFSKKENSIILGFSAGAIVLTPTIQIADLPIYDVNTVGLEDLTGLSLVPFEIFPHYDESFSQYVAEYKNSCKNEVRTISDDEYIVLENGAEVRN